MYNVLIDNHYEDLQIVSLDSGEEIYLWEYNNYTYLNVTKNLVNLKFEQHNYCKKSKLIKNKNKFIIVNSEDNKSSENIITTKTIGLQNYNNLGYKIGPYISLQTSKYTFKSLKVASLASDLQFTDTDEIITNAGEITSNNFLTTGILQIDSELIKYTGYDVGDNKFTGITRGFQNTPVQDHPSGMKINLISTGIEN